MWIVQRGAYRRKRRIFIHLCNIWQSFVLNMHNRPTKTIHKQSNGALYGAGGLQWSEWQEDDTITGTPGDDSQSRTTSFTSWQAWKLCITSHSLFTDTEGEDWYGDGMKVDSGQGWDLKLKGWADSCHVHISEPDVVKHPKSIICCWLNNSYNILSHHNITTATLFVFLFITLTDILWIKTFFH